MRYRSLSEIFPAYYFDAPDTEDIRRTCTSHLSVVQMPDDVYRWIEKKDCPYKQEAYCVGMIHLLEDLRTDEDCDLLRGLNTYQWEDILHHLHRIIRYAQTDQLAQEMLHSEEESPVPEADIASVPVFVSMQNQLNILQKQVESILKDKTLPTTLIQPLYTSKADPKERQWIEDRLRNICAKRNRSITAEIKKFLRLKQKEGMICLPIQLSDEYDVIRQFGYPYTIKTYRNCQI